jgi:hypothetical protein
MMTATVKLSDADEMSVSELSALPVETLRKLFTRYRKTALYLISRDVFDLHLARKDPKTPAEWVDAARTACGTCERCRGGGIFYWGASINGRMSHSATCARCAGKGKVNNNDCRRAYVYDNHAIRRAAGF